MRPVGPWGRAAGPAAAPAPHAPPLPLQLDAGVPEKISLTSRDEKSVLVVAYSDLKRCFENTFQELIAAANGQS